MGRILHQLIWYCKYPMIYKVLYIQTVVVWDVWTINRYTLLVVELRIESLRGDLKGQ